MIARNRCLNRLIRAMRNGDVKIVSGVRGCGKTVLLFGLFRGYLLERGVEKERILCFELGKRKHAAYRDPDLLCETVEKIVSADRGRDYFLLIDNIELVRSVPYPDGLTATVFDVLNELMAHKNLDVYAVCADAVPFSLDVPTEFRGRSTQIVLRPLSFAEFYSYEGGDVREALDRHMLYGGMPGAVLAADETEKRAYLDGLLREIAIKDVLKGKDRPRREVLNAVLDHVASRTGSPADPAGIAAALAPTSGEGVDADAVSSCMARARDALLMDAVRPFDIRGRRYPDGPEKYYWVDTGLRAAATNFRPSDPGALMENVLYEELADRGYSVDYGVFPGRGKNEGARRGIDFVVNFADRRAYVQSAWREEDADILPFGLTGDFFRKVLIRADIPDSRFDDNGVFQCALTDFLLDRVSIF